MSPHRLTQQPRPRSRTLQTEAVGVASIVGLPGEHRGMGAVHSTSMVGGRSGDVHTWEALTA